MIECTKADISTGDSSNPRGNLRLIATDGTMAAKAGHIDDEPNDTTSDAMIDVANFAVTNSEGLELIQWHTGK